MIAFTSAIVLSLLVSAFCSITEAALYSITWSAIETLKEKKPRRGTLLAKLRSNVEEPISAILTLNTIANTAGATIAGAYCSSLWGEASLSIFVIAFTVAILLLAEIIPKTLGVAYSMAVCNIVLYPLIGVIFILKPLIIVIKKITTLFYSPQEPNVTEEDIRAIVTLSQRGGKIQQYEALSIHNILTLDTKCVEDIMTPRTVVFSLPAHALLSEIQSKPGVWNYSRIPVYGEDNEDIVGIVTRKELLQMSTDSVDAPLYTVMKPVHFVLEKTKLDVVLQQFLDSQSHLFVVLDEYGGLAGVVSLEDVLEEILGREIVDETDQVADLQQLARQRRATLIRKNSKQKKDIFHGQKAEKL